MSEAFQRLTQKFSQLQKVLDKRKQNKQQRKKQKQQQATDLYDSIQQKTDNMISKLQDLKRKQTIIITIQKVQPSIPQNFPKNYFIQLVYEDVTITGNQKFTDFDQNVIEEKFIIPLLTSTKVKVEIWTAQQEPALFDKMQLDIQRVIQQCLLNGNKCNDQIYLNTSSQFKFTFHVQLQGIGFSSWLKNVNLLRQLQTQKQIIKEQQIKRRQKIRNKLEQKKKHFNSKFPEKKPLQTKQYQTQQIEEILEILADD